MSTDFPGRAFLIVLIFSIALSTTSCSAPVQKAESDSNTEIANSSAQETNAPSVPSDVDQSVIDRVHNERWTGDIDGMVQRRFVRAIVLYNKTNFFYDGPQPKGIAYDALKEFEKFLNQKLKTGDKPIYIMFIPVSREEAVKRMQDGRGDIAVGNIAIAADLEKFLDFSDPTREQAKELVVGGPSAAAIATIDDLSGKEVFIRKFSRYWLTLERLNEKFHNEHKSPVILKEADPNLEDDDLLNMVASGQVQMTMTDDMTAGLWSAVFPELKVYSDIPLVTDDRIGWAVQNGAANFVTLVNEFIKDHKQGTSFGNTILAKYLQNTKWAKNNVAPSEMEKFKGAISYFKKYGAEDKFEWLMIAAQAYQESQIDQSRTSPAGAVGVMQIKPSTAAGEPINITGVETNMENNIHAGVKYLNFIMDRYFADAKMDATDRALFAFASYNAGPAKIAKLRKMAENDGLDPNIWFGNVELIAAREIGPETVTYVSNIYKYYVAYKLASGVTNKRSKAT
jgi:membrane-bound lytic murein transglycosylase MltF